MEDILYLLRFDKKVYFNIINENLLFFFFCMLDPEKNEFVKFDITFQRRFSYYRISRNFSNVERKKLSNVNKINKTNLKF